MRNIARLLAITLLAAPAISELELLFIGIFLGYIEFIKRRVSRRFLLVILYFLLKCNFIALIKRSF